MTSSLDCILLSLSVPRRDAVTVVEIVRQIKEHPVDWRSIGLAEAFFTEISRQRIAETVGEGHFDWWEIAASADVYSLQETATGRWSREMAGI